MTYDQDLVDRVRALLGGTVSERRMFGGLAFLIHGSMGVAASGSGGLMVRVDPAQTEALREEPGVGPVDMGRGPVRGWVRVQAEELDDRALEGWVRRGVAAALAAGSRGA